MICGSIRFMVSPTVIGVNLDAAGCRQASGRIGG